MKHFYHILMLVLILQSGSFSAFAQKSVYALPFENSVKLPSLDVYIDMDEMAATYQSNGEVWNTQYTDTEEESAEIVSTSYQNDEKIVDATRFLKYYLFEELLAYSDEKQGSVEIKVSYFEENARASVGSLVSFATLGIALFFGCPVYRNVVDLEIEAVFYDSEGKYISTYRGIGHGSSAQSMYSHTERKTHRKALTKALGDLNTKILADPLLPERLSNPHKE